MKLNNFLSYVGSDIIAKDGCKYYVIEISERDNGSLLFVCNADDGEDHYFDYIEIDWKATANLR